MPREMEMDIRPTPGPTPAPSGKKPTGQPGKKSLAQVIADSTPPPEVVPYQREITLAARGFPNVFTGESIRPVVLTSLKFAKTIQGQIWRERWLWETLVHKLFAGTATAESVGRDMDGAVARLEAVGQWALQEKSGRLYRNGQDKEWALVQSTVLYPYMVAAAFEGGKDPGFFANVKALTLAFAESTERLFKKDLPDWWDSAKPWLIFGGVVVGVSALSNLIGSRRA